MKNHIWSLFLQTGNIEAYLLLKQIENEQLDDQTNTDIAHEDITPLQTKM